MGIAQIDISLKKTYLVQLNFIVFVSQSNGKHSNRQFAQTFLCRFITDMAPTPKSDVAQAIASVYKTEWGRIVAILIRLVGDFDLAEEAAQETAVPGTSDYVKFSPNIFTFNSTDGGFRDG